MQPADFKAQARADHDWCENQEPTIAVTLQNSNITK